MLTPPSLTPLGQEVHVCLHVMARTTLSIMNTAQRR
jgi:hypothetical protein